MAPATNKSTMAMQLQMWAADCTSQCRTICAKFRQASECCLEVYQQIYKHGLWAARIVLPIGMTKRCCKKLIPSRVHVEQIQIFHIRNLQGAPGRCTQTGRSLSPPRHHVTPVDEHFQQPRRSLQHPSSFLGTKEPQG